ncbi:hypothetical protein F2P81_004107 [Scophthalmus maximus]|uniref:Uncharacterized protein n=1 Tax=Scophthalmus maximus TaxID=52904 RepID=A0A6A4TG84_SCOMX|nr:hypothetical protein F2P81_004107 [Scophthalmus maximus]
MNLIVYLSVGPPQRLRVPFCLCCVQRLNVKIKEHKLKPELPVDVRSVNDDLRPTWLLGSTTVNLQRHVAAKSLFGLNREASWHKKEDLNTGLM